MYSDSRACIFLTISEAVSVLRQETAITNSGMGMHLTGGMNIGLMQFMRDEDGVSFIECALVVSLIAVVAGIAALAWSKGKNGWL